MAQGLHLILTIFCVHLICVSSQQETGFIYKGSSETDHGDAKGLLQLTDGSRLKMGHTFNSNRSLFSTQFVCALVSKAGFVCGHHTALLVQAVVLPTIIMYLALGAFFVYVRRRYAKLSEEWEKEFNGPRRSTYKSLYMATKGFKKDGLVRKRGFREVIRRTPIETARREEKEEERRGKIETESTLKKNVEAICGVLSQSPNNPFEFNRYGDMYTTNI